MRTSAFLLFLRMKKRSSLKKAATKRRVKIPWPQTRLRVEALPPKMSLLAAKTA
jgi:hypothetical protein